MTNLIRAIVSLLAGWVAAGFLVFAALHVFGNGPTMNIVGVAAIGIGLVVAATVWRLTRVWKPRDATPDELANGFKVHFAAAAVIFFGAPIMAFLGMAILLSIQSVPLIGAGLCFLLLAIWVHFAWRTTRPWPAALDPEGMTLRNGRRILWSEITEVNKVVTTSAGMYFTERWEIRSPSGRALVVPNSLAEGPAVITFLLRASNTRSSQ